MKTWRLRPDLCECDYDFTIVDGVETLVAFRSVCGRHEGVIDRHGAIIEESRRFNRVVDRLRELAPDAPIPHGRIDEDGVLVVTTAPQHRGKLLAALRRDSKVAVA